MLAIHRAAREWLRLDSDCDKQREAIVKNTERKEAILKQWGDALTATIAEIRDKQEREKAEGV
jgi:hypothetical protein